MRKRHFTLFLLIMCLMSVQAEDGSRLWLRLEANGHPAQVVADRALQRSATVRVAIRELQQYWRGGQVTLVMAPDAPQRDGFSLLRQADGSILVRSASACGLLYGSYALLRMQQVGTALPVGREQVEEPAYDLRVLNHWDNPDGTIERGYAGHSLWRWQELPGTLSPRYEAYARANASIGINLTVLNNVNAKPLALSSDMLRKTAAIANVMRPYGIRVCLAVNFASPKVLGQLPDADPLNPAVVAWWQHKVDEIYRLIPDFGGFLVKANSEGEPGPQDYGRTHAQGANMLADVLQPHGGVVMWRAFVYQAHGTDRAMQAYQEFMPLDGAFRPNVIVQVKNGPIDFQPREPFSPLFGGLTHTQVMPELQITQEYLGHSIHTVFLAPMWKECLDAPTFCPGQLTVAGSTLRRVTPTSCSAIAGVSNVGDTLNWCGNDLAQANWYAFGRLAWNPGLSSEQLAREFLSATYTPDTAFVRPVSQLLLRSWSACVDYMMPLGLHHIFAYGHHYGPEPWCNPPGARIDWLPLFYHRADSIGLGYDRSRQGSGAVDQYHEPLASMYNDLRTCPERYLTWFHHVPWGYVMPGGLTFWDVLCYTYDEGMRTAASFVKVWEQVAPYVDAQRYAAQHARFCRQAADARWWRDACLQYFARFSGRSLPPGSPAPVFSLDSLMRYRLPIDNYRPPVMGDLPMP